MIAHSPTVSPAVFTCSICGEPSTDICAYCTKDACSNHRCVRCKRCSDCCECDVPLSAEEVVIEEAAVIEVRPEEDKLENKPEEATLIPEPPPEPMQPSELAAIFAPEPGPRPEWVSGRSVFIEQVDETPEAPADPGHDDLTEPDETEHHE
jgi:transcription elongation factor Elf1